ncbi:MAG: hypothetical protein ICV74_00355 [Thermoleophilia bacterium]|nr:hypothetical protein [Thermoleophilia bacterium]
MFGRRRTRGTRWDQDNRLVFNPAPLLVIAAVTAAIVGLALLLTLL